MRFIALDHGAEVIREFNSLDSAKAFAERNDEVSYIEDSERYIMYTYLGDGEWDRELTHELADVPPGIGLMKGERPTPMYMGGSSMSGSLPNSMTS